MKTIRLGEEDFCNSPWTSRLRYALIKLIAGRSVIILNAHIQIATRQCPDVCAVVKNVNGFLLHNNSFPDAKGLELQITQQPKL